MEQKKSGGSFAIAGFVYQFLNTIDQGLSASLRRGTGDDLILILEPPDADAAGLGIDPRVFQYKTRSTGPWPVRKLLFEILPPLLRASLATQEPAYAPTFVTSTSIRNAVAVRHCLAAFGSNGPDEALRVGNRWMTPEEILMEVAARTAVNAIEVEDPLFRERLRALLARTILEENVKAAQVRRRVVGKLRKATGSERLAARAYNGLFTFIAERSQEGAAGITARAFLAAAELTPERLAPLVEFDRRVTELTARALVRRGYDRHRDVRPVDFSGDASMLLVEGRSGSGKSWSLAGLATAELDRGGIAIWVDQVESIEVLGAEVIRQLWQTVLRRSDPTSLPNLHDDIGDVLGRDRSKPILLVLDRLPSLPAERQRLLQFDWAESGIRLAIAANAAEASEIQNFVPAPVIHVGDLTQTQLKDLLERHGLTWASLPADVRKWIARPVLAGIYAELAGGSGEWAGTNEYLLLDRFAERAKQRGDARGIFGCRKVIASLGGDALSHAQPLMVNRLAQPPSQEQLGILIETGWLQRDSDGELIFAHDRLRDWAIAEHLVRTNEDPAQLATRLAGLAGYGPQNDSPPTLRAGYSLMDGIWLLSQHAGSASRLGQFLDEMDEAGTPWNLREDLYDELLPTGGSEFLLALLPSLRERLTGGNEQRAWHARRCIQGFARNRQGSILVVTSLLQSGQVEEQSCGCLLAAANPDRRFVGRLASLHAEATQNHAEPGDEWESLQRGAWRALRECLLRQPGWLTARFDQAAANGFPQEGHLLSFIAKLPEGRSLWDRHGPALVARFESDPLSRYWLARCIEAFEDRRFDERLAQWSASPKGMAALRAWTELCRHRPDLVPELVATLPKGLFSWNTSKWLPPLFQPHAGPALAAVLEVLKANDPSGCNFAFVLCGHADALPDRELAWAASRLNEALLGMNPKDLTVCRLLDFFASIEELGVIDRLRSLVPSTLPERLLALIETRLAIAGLWHDPELAGALILMQRLGPEHGAAAMSARLRGPHPTLRWMAVREAGFSDVSLLRPELEAIADAGDEEKEPGRLEAVELLAAYDPQWGHTRIGSKLEEGTASARNEAFWIAIRMSGDDYVSDAAALLPRLFESSDQPLYLVVDYLVSRRAQPAEVSQILRDALPQRPENRQWIIRHLLSLRRPEADETVRDDLTATNDKFDAAGFAFWALVNRPHDERWRAIARASIEAGETLSLRHLPGFYEAAATLGGGPGYDQLLSDANPANPTEWRRALHAIEALGLSDLGMAQNALRRLCTLLPADDRDFDRFAEEAARLDLPDHRSAILEGAAHWPAGALVRAMEPDGEDYGPKLAAHIEADLCSPLASRRRAAAVCAPLVLDRAPEELADDPVEDVREAVREASLFHVQRQRAKRLLAEMANASAERSRRAAAVLFSIATRNKPDRRPLIFSWLEFAAAAPRGSGLHLAIPR